jgi:hypothetical protein
VEAVETFGNLLRGRSNLPRLHFCELRCMKSVVPARTPSVALQGLECLLPTLSLLLIGLLLGAFAHPLGVLGGNTLLDPLGQEPQRFFFLEASVRTALR